MGAKNYRERWDDPLLHRYIPIFGNDELTDKDGLKMDYQFEIFNCTS